jgi:hypothetical protein
MRLHHRRLLSAALLTTALLWSGSAARPVAAQGGENDVIFWDDAGETSGTADVPAPADLVNAVYLNPNGGRTPDDGLLVVVAEEGIQVIRDRDWQIYSSAITTGSMSWVLYADGYCVNSDSDCTGNTDAGLGTVVSDIEFDDESVELTQNGPTTWKARQIESVLINDTTFTVTTIVSYTPPSPYVGLEATVTASPAYTGTMHLYLVADMYLDGSDDGPGFADEFDGNQIVVQINQTGVGGIAQTGRRFDSYFEGYYTCLYSEYSLADCGNSAAHWSVDESSPDHWFGPGFGEPFPMPAIVDGRSNGDLPEELDAGVGAHWNITTNRTVKTSLIFLSTDAFNRTESTPAAYCTQPATLEIKPDPLEIAPGGAATVWVEMTNPCRDLPTAPADALLSFSDGLTVINTSDGVLNLGQRAALQRFSLAAGQTLGWYAIVRATDPFVTAPLAIGEIFAGAAVVRTDSLNFTTPAPAPAPAPVVEVPAPAPAAPAPLPAVLPNTSGGALPGLLLPALAALGAAGLAARRISRR